jgi:hypothetical protein
MERSRRSFRTAGGCPSLRPDTHTRAWLRLAKMTPGFVWPKCAARLALMLRSLAARRRCIRTLGALRCVSKHGRTQWFVLILRDARTRVRVCGTRSACALLRMRTSRENQLTMSNSPSRSRARIAASGLCLFASLTPVEGWAEHRETFGCLRDTRWTCRNAACQAPSEAPCVP